MITGQRGRRPPQAAPTAPVDGAEHGDRRLWPVVVGCVALAVLSITLPSTLTYDSWSWLTWGREIFHLDLDTHGFIAAWKPLPVLAAAVFSVTGRAAPMLWLVTARAGGLVAVVLSYRLAKRVGGTGAGVVAALALLTSADFSGYLLPLGMSEPLLAALVLCAIERHLDGRHFQAWLLVYAASLLRPEAWPFLGLYALWLWRSEPRRRALLALLVVLLPVLWFGPDLWGSGDAFRSLHRADVPTQGGPLLTPHPGLAVLTSAARYLPVPFGLAALSGMAAALSSLRAKRYASVTPVVLVVTALWLTLTVAATQAGRSSGDQRYLIVAGAGASVLAGVGWSCLVRAGGRLAARLCAGHGLVTAGRVAISLVLVAFAAPFVVARVERLGHDARELRYQAALYGQLPAAVEALGGREHVIGCGGVYAGFYQAPAVAWQLGLHLGDVRPTTAPAGAERATRALHTGAAGQLAHWSPAVPRAPGTVFRSRATRGGPPPPPVPPSEPGFAVITRVGRWQVAAACAQGGEGS